MKSLKRTRGKGSPHQFWCVCMCVCALEPAAVNSYGVEEYLHWNFVMLELNALNEVNETAAAYCVPAIQVGGIHPLLTCE